MCISLLLLSLTAIHVKQFEVECILGKKVVKGKISYLLLWKGTSIRSWEPSSCLSCDDLVKKFEVAQH